MRVHRGSILAPLALGSVPEHDPKGEKKTTVNTPKPAKEVVQNKEVQEEKKINPHDQEQLRVAQESNDDGCQAERERTVDREEDLWR